MFTFGLSFINLLIEITGTVSHNWLGSVLYDPGILRFYPFSGMEMRGFAIVYFCIGGLVLDLEEKIQVLSVKRRVVLPLVLIIISSFILFLIGIFESKYISGDIWDVVYTGYDSICTFIDVLCIFVLSLNYKRDNAFIRVLSCNTLGVYFMHGIILYLLKPLISQLSLMHNIPCNLMYAFLIMVFCMGLSFMLKKIPFLKKLV